MNDLKTNDLIFHREEYVKQLSDLEKQLGLYSELSTFSTVAIRRLLSTISDPDARASFKKVLKIRGEIDGILQTIGLCDRILEKNAVVRCESGDLAVDTGMEMKIEENVTEISSVSDGASAGRSRNAQQGQQEVVDMDDFLSRPVEIYTTSLALSTNLTLEIDPWTLFLNLPAIRAKLRNFAFLRANLKVKVSVAGTPFHYGRILLSYQPFAYDNDNYMTLAGITPSADSRKMFLNYLSQAPGSMVMNVNENIPVVVSCPFISPKPMGRLFNYSAAVLAAGTDISDFDGIGVLSLFTVNQIKAVSATPTPLYIQIYAWMEDVQLGTTTGTQIAVTTESGKLDEREVGPVEAVASRVFDISSKLTKIPYLYPYAKASEIAAGAVRNVSALFGWSVPILNQDPMRIKNEPYCNGANVIGTNISQRVTLDPKQELAVDSTIVGVDHDDMIISNISSRWIYLNTFTWADTDVAMVAPIWTCDNSPNLVTYHNSGTRVFCQPTAMSFAALPFAYWRGSIKYRFEVVCSSFHRGRLAVYFEPNVSQRVLINANVSLNKQFIAIVDIQENDTFEVTVNWANSRPWLRVGTAQTGYLHTDQTTVAADGLANGYIGIIPFTSLQSPDSSDISVNVYVCCEDLQVNGLTSSNLYSSRRAYAESGCLRSCDIPSIEVNRTTATTDGLCEDYFGEQPISFRSLIKRFVLDQQISIGSDATTAPRVNTVTNRISPPNNLYYGATSVTTYFDMFTYLRYAYLGYRGSIRFRMRPYHSTAVYPLEWIKFGLAPPASTFAATSTFSAFGVANGASLEGSITICPSTNSGIEFEVPYYSSNLFSCSFGDSADNDDFLVGTVTESTYFRNFIMNYDLWGGSITTWKMDVERAAGEDFTFLRFQGAPWFCVDPVA